MQFDVAPSLYRIAYLKRSVGVSLRNCNASGRVLYKELRRYKRNDAIDGNLRRTIRRLKPETGNWHGVEVGLMIPQFALHRFKKALLRP
jgi:hypothetical protein